MQTWPISNTHYQFIRGFYNTTLQTDILATSLALESMEDVLKYAEILSTLSTTNQRLHPLAKQKRCVSPVTSSIQNQANRTKPTRLVRPRHIQADILIRNINKNQPSSDPHRRHGCSCRGSDPPLFFEKNENFWQLFLKKCLVFGNFFEKDIKFLAIFWHSNGNFPEGQVVSKLINNCPRGALLL